VTEWRNLNTLAGQHVGRCDVCIIGAGAAGIYAAKRLASLGASVIVLEAGPERCTDIVPGETGPLFPESLYHAATIGRSFGLGGTTSRWGGALVPHTERDFRNGTRDDMTWRHIVSVVEQVSSDVLRGLGYSHDADFTQFAKRTTAAFSERLAAAGLCVQSWMHLPLRRKNLVCLLFGAGTPSSRITVYGNAIATGWDVSGPIAGDHAIRGVTAQSPSGNAITVHAKNYVIAAGTIESTRLLLELSERYATMLPTADCDLGTFLGDHISGAIADVGAESLALVARAFGPRFSGPWMRGYRFLERGCLGDSPRCFAHFIFENKSAGFALAKDVFAALQRRQFPSLGPQEWMAGMGDGWRLAFERYARSRLFIPPGTAAHLQLDMEQLPSIENRISLDTARDKLGRKVPRIQWAIRNADTSAFRDLATRVLAQWASVGHGLPRLIARSVGSDGTKPHDAYHPVGTCRMGSDARAVVDYTGRVRGAVNLWMASTAVLPTAGTANPTFTMLCLVHRLTEMLASGSRH
jgi:choline dehydrogenase-like flavoprotein